MHFQPPCDEVLGFERFPLWARRCVPWCSFKGRKNMADASRSWPWNAMECHGWAKATYIIWLVVWNMFYFPRYWEFHHPKWLTHIFQRGGEKPPTSDLISSRMKSHRVIAIKIKGLDQNWLTWSSVWQDIYGYLVMWTTTGFWAFEPSYSLDVFDHDLTEASLRRSSSFQVLIITWNQIS